MNSTNTNRLTTRAVEAVTVDLLQLRDPDDDVISLAEGD